MAATIAASAAALGALAQTGGSIYSTERNIANANYQAQLSRDFERDMASTQYQRAVKDMEAAGLNPGALGASMSANAVPSAVAATGAYAHTPDFGNMFSSAVSAAMSKDKNMTRKITQEMRDETALQVQRLRNQGLIENEIQKKAMKHKSYIHDKKDDYTSSALNDDIRFEEL